MLLGEPVAFLMQNEKLVLQALASLIQAEIPLDLIVQLGLENFFTLERFSQLELEFSRSRLRSLYIDLSYLHTPTLSPKSRRAIKKVSRNCGNKKAPRFSGLFVGCFNFAYRDFFAAP